MKNLKVEVSDQSKVHDNLITFKYWINRMIRFFTVKLVPPNW